jgi:hypothetical protein
VDNQSAREILAARLEKPAAAAAPGGGGAAPKQPAAPHKQAAPQQHKQPAAPHRQPTAQHKQAAGAMGGGVAAVGAFLQSSQGKQLQKEVMRGVFGLLKKRR